MASEQPRVLRPAAWPSWLRLQSPHPAERARTAADWRLDWALFAGSVMFGGGTLASLWGDYGPVLRGLDVAAGSVACLALWARRSRPVTALAVFVAASFSPLALGAGLVAVFNAALRTRDRRALLGLAVLTVASGVAFPLANPRAAEVFRPALPAFLLGVIAFGAGLFVQARRELVTSLRQRADQVAADQARRVTQAREQERRRIAREMHDVLAHRLSLLSIHAGALQFRPDASPAEIARAATVIRASAASALDELNQVITVLREDTASDTSAPQPTLAELPGLLDESRVAGMCLTEHVQLDGCVLPVAVGRAAYRVIQEGLTNARKHAPGSPVQVDVAARRDGQLLIEVITHVAGQAAPANPASASGGGSGLIGLAERLALVGGTLDHHTVTTGGFVLRATMPITQPASPPLRLRPDD